MYVYFPSIACHRSLFLITSIEISKCDHKVSSLRNSFLYPCRSLSYLCARVYLSLFLFHFISLSFSLLSLSLSLSLSLFVCPMTSRFRLFHSCSPESKRSACRCFTANTDLHVHLAQYNTVSFSPLCKS